MTPHCQFCLSLLTSQARFCSTCGKSVSDSNPSSPLKENFDAGHVIDKSGVTGTDEPAKKYKSQDRKKIVKPNALSINAIRHTLFVIPEHFSDTLEEILAIFGAKTAGLIYSRNGACVVERCQEIIREALPGAIRYVCIIGNWDDVPPLNVPNDFGLNDGDDFCQSDAFFGATGSFNLEDPFTAIPDIPVGRIPIADLEIVQRVLGSDPELSPTRNLFQYGVTAQCWEVASKEIVSSFPNLAFAGPLELFPEDVSSLPKSVLLSSPHWTELDFRRVAGTGPSDPFSLIYFNVHGGADEPQWVGEGENGGYVRIFEPGTVVDFNSALLVTEACYGGALSYDTPSIVEHFFTSGGHSFVGSSTIAYGAKATPISAADMIAKHYVLGLYSGLTCGEALKVAKMEALAEDPIILEYGLKTALSFNLFGAPWQTLVRTPIASTPTSSITERPSNSVLNRVRNNLRSPITANGSTINKIREEYRSRLPPRNRQFMIESLENLTRLREFKDFSRIMDEISRWGGSLDDVELDFVSAGNSQGYRLVCTVNKAKNSKRTLILITDASGQLKKSLVSKGCK